MVMWSLISVISNNLTLVRASKTGTSPNRASQAKLVGSRGSHANLHTLLLSQFPSFFPDLLSGAFDETLAKDTCLEGVAEISHNDGDLLLGSRLKAMFCCAVLGGLGVQSLRSRDENEESSRGASE